MLRMKSRSEVPNGGWQWFDPKTQWKPDFGLRDFYACRDEIVAHNAANPRHGLSTNPDAVADALDFFNAAVRKGDPRWCVTDAPGKALPPSAAGAFSGGLKSAAAAVVERAAKTVAGIGILLDLFGPSGKTVDQELANQRAAVCVGCPKNERGDLIDFFTGMAIEKIHQQLELRRQMGLHTPSDGQINVCTGCHCHLQTKVWVDIGHIIKKLKPEWEADLDPRCWVLSEKKAIQTEKA